VSSIRLFTAKTDGARRFLFALRRSDIIASNTSNKQRADAHTRSIERLSTLLEAYDLVRSGNGAVLEPEEDSSCLNRSTLSIKFLAVSRS
jgi:hypothetical protein